MVSSTTDFVIPSKKLYDLAEHKSCDIITQLVTMSIDKLIEEGIFDKDVTGFDIERECFTIRRSAFPLEYAAIRNFLISAGAFDNGEHGEICISREYEANLTEQLQNRRKKLSLEELLEEQKKQNKRGLDAEEFVLKLEKIDCQKKHKR